MTARPLVYCLAMALLRVLNAAASAPPDVPPKPSVIVVVGAAGEEKYGPEFRESARHWQKAAALGNATCVVIGADSESTNDLARLQSAISKEPSNAPAELWLVLLGHGTWDGRHARFNMRGDDLSATNLAQLLSPFTRPVAIINAASASAPFINALSRSNRVIVTSTRSGVEDNYSRFGKYFSESIANQDADLDKDGQTSLLEAFLLGSRQVAEFYISEGRLATEHALIDDNGDALGTPADFFRGIRAVKAAQGGNLDGLRAHQWHLVRNAEEQQVGPEQRRERNRIELAIAALREKKSQMSEEAYYAELERLMVEFGALLSAPTTNSRATAGPR